MSLVADRVGWARAYGVAIGGILGGLAGSRIFHVADAWQYYAAHPADVLALWNGGAAVTGGIVGGIVGAIVVARRRGMPIGYTLDHGVVGLSLGMAIGRIGAIVNGEHHATACAGVPWCVRYTDPNTLGQQGPVHPLLFLVRRNMRDGQLVLLFVLLYGIARLGLSRFRLDPLWLVGVSQAVVVSFAFIAIGAAGLLWLRTRSAPRRAAPILT
jgi:phosphatidylglycerol:prolipoprotein diacylglycerol transferase